MMRRFILCAIGLLAVVGCSSERYRVAAVSGRVTVNDKPLPNAWVTFAPMGTLDSNPGPTSQARTDSDGRYTLHLDVQDKPAGAVVGKSRVYIRTATYAGKGEQPDAGGKNTPELLPARYHSETTLTFEVPADGTDQANFPLTIP